MWSLTNFGATVYVLLASIIVFYLLPNLRLFSNSHFSGNRKRFFWLSGTSVTPLVVTPLILIFLVLLSWSGPSLVVWYSHLIYHNWHYRLSYLVLFMFTMVLFTFLSTFVFTNNQVYDFVVVMYNFFFLSTPIVHFKQFFHINFFYRSTFFHDLTITTHFDLFNNIFL